MLVDTEQQGAFLLILSMDKSVMTTIACTIKPSYPRENVKRPLVIAQIKLLNDLYRDACIQALGELPIRSDIC